MRDLMTAAGLRRTRAVRWDTGGRAFNAMVAGFMPPLRTLLISDRLVDELPREQIAMVVLHEAAHLRRRHVPIRMLAILPAWGAGAMVTRIIGEQSWAVAAGSAVGILMTMLILRIVAYRTEYDADVQACRLAAQISDQVDSVPLDVRTCRRSFIGRLDASHVRSAGRKKSNLASPQAWLTASIGCVAIAKHRSPTRPPPAPSRIPHSGESQLARASVSVDGSGSMQMNTVTIVSRPVTNSDQNPSRCKPSDLKRLMQRPR